MLLCEALAVTPTDMLLVVMDENKKELFDGLVCEVDNDLAARPIKGLGVFEAYSSCFQAVVADPVDIDSHQSLQAIPTRQDEPKQRKKRVVKNFDGPADLPTMLSVYDLMDFLQCGQVQAYQLTHSVGFPSIKVGGTIQIPKYLFIKWLEDQAKNQIL